MSPHYRYLLLALPLLVVACEDPAKDKPQATVAPAVETKPAASAVTPAAVSAAPAAASAAMAAASGAPAGAAVYAISPAGSKIEWEGSKVTGKHVGTFGTFNGKVTVPDGKVETSKIAIDIDMASLTTDQEKLVGHLKSPDFFDVAKFPKATFESTAIVPGGTGGATHTVTGNLELHGEKKSITFPATITLEGGHAKAKSEFVIKRSDFGIVYPGKPNDLIRQDVLIRLTIDAPKS